MKSKNENKPNYNNIKTKIIREYTSNERKNKIRNNAIYLQKEKEKDTRLDINSKKYIRPKANLENLNVSQNYKKRNNTNEMNNQDIIRINSVENFSGREDKGRDYSLNNKIRNTYSTYIINRKNNINIDNINNKNRFNNKKNEDIKISGFELFYESDKGEKNSYKSYIKNNKNNNPNSKYNNPYHCNINLDEDNHKKIINKEYKNNFFYNINNNNSQSYIINNRKNRININDSIEIKDIQKKIIDKRRTKYNENTDLISRVIKSNTSNKNNANINSYNTISKKNVRYSNYYRPSDKKKIILIQSTYRMHLSKAKLYEYINICLSYEKLLELLKKLFLKKKEEIYKFIIQKLKKMKKNNKIMNTKRKIIMKTNEVTKLHKELGDSFNIANDELKIKLDNVIKENNELKNQILDNKNIEKKMKLLQEENKKNQNINNIIMKDNKQLAKRLKNMQDNRNNQLVIQNQLSVGLNQVEDDLLKMESISKLKYLYLKCIFFKKVLKNRNSLRIYFNKYKNNIKKGKKYSIENNNIYINNKKNINIQMAKNFNINFISQNDNYKHFLLLKLFMKKEQIKSKILPKFFYKYLYIINNIQNNNNNDNELKKLLKKIIMKREKYNAIIIRKILKEWKLRSVIFRMKGIAKEIKKKKKLKKKIREKIAKETLNNIKNKMANFQSAHEFSYKIDKINKKDNEKNVEELKDNSNNISIHEESEHSF